MKFIRVRGRVVPIKEKGEDVSVSQHKAMAKIGALQGVYGRLLRERLPRTPVFQGLRLGMAISSVGLAGIGLFASTVAGIKHGKEKNSVAHGIKRFATMELAGTAGALAGFAGSHLALMGTSKGARGLANIIKKRRVASGR